MSEEREEQTVIGDTEKTEPTQKLLELPPEIRELRNLQLETKEIQSKFFRKIYELEIEFQKKHELVFQKRSDIVNGSYAIKTETESVEQQIESWPCIPRFWSNVLSSTLFEIQKSDRPILEHLTDVRARNKPFSELGFVLEFDFSPNEYFENATLTKEYYYKCSSGSSDMVHQSPQIHKSIGCEIKWKSGKSAASDSFFNFFRTKNESEESAGNDGTYEMSHDFEMGYFIKERIIPRAVLFYNEHFHIVDPPLRSCHSFEPIPPTTSSMLPNTGSSATATTSTVCDPTVDNE